MPYGSNKELPEAVRNKFKHKPKKQRQFRHVWNSAFSRHGDESRAFAEAWATVQKSLTLSGDPVMDNQVDDSGSNFSFFLPITKIDKDRRQVSGYASTPTVDMDGEIVSLDAVKKALPGYWEWRNIREMHTSSAVGVAKEANVDHTGLFVTAKIVDDDAWQKCVEQVYKGFSIGGKKLAKTGNTITEIDLVEISVVDRPANPDCRFAVQKKAKDPGGAHLIKARSPEEKLLRKVQKTLDYLLKQQREPNSAPAGHDGFSLPAKIKKSKKCAAHGLKNCAMCKQARADTSKPDPEADSTIENNPFERKAKVKKRDVSAEERQRLASQGNALPGGGFPIKNKSDLDNARQAIGRAKNPGKARALIRRRARELGVKLPDNWTKKQARFMIKAAEIELLDYQLSLPNDDSMLSKRAKDDPETGTTPTTTPKSYELELGAAKMDGKEGEGLGYSLDQVLDALAKRGAVPTRAQHLQIARTNMKKARKARQSAMSSIKECHAMHKASYLAKASKASKKPDNDDDDFDHTGAMEKLAKAYGNLDSMKTFMKAANNHLKKAAGRTGQSGQEVGDSKAPWYTVPEGVKDTSQSELTTAGPGGSERGSEPPILTMESVFPGKAAKGQSLITREHAEALIRAAAAEAESKILKAMPAPTNGRRPLAFDVSKLANSPNDTAATTVLMNGVDANGLVSDDENLRKLHVGKLVGNMIMSGMGRSVFDPAFHGTAGA